MSFLGVCKREVLSIAKDPRRILFLLGALWAYLFLFGALYEPGVVKNIPVVIYDADQTAMSRTLIRRIEENDSFRWAYNAVSEEEMVRALKEKEAYVAIEIPVDFSKNIRTGGSSNILYLVNGSNIVYTSTSALALQDTVNNFSDKVAIRQMAMKLGVRTDRLEQKLTPVSFNWRIINNPTQTYLLFFCIGLALTAFQQGMLMAMGASIHQDFGEFKLLEGTPLWRILLGKFFVLWCFAQVSFLVFLSLSDDVWGIPMRCSLWEIWSLNAVANAAVLSLGLGASVYFPNELKFVKASLLYVVPSFILSGYTWPLFCMPDIIQWLAKICFPITWTIDPARNLMLGGSTVDLWKNIVVLAIMAIVTIPLGVRGYKIRYYKWLEKRKVVGD